MGQGRVTFHVILNLCIRYILGLMIKSRFFFFCRYDNALKQFLLKKFLQIVFFLDQAKAAKIIKHDPCLFGKNASIKVRFCPQLSRVYF